MNQRTIDSIRRTKNATAFYLDSWCRLLMSSEWRELQDVQVKAKVLECVAHLCQWQSADAMGRSAFSSVHLAFYAEHCNQLELLLKGREVFIQENSA